jgi:hypothetical protein
LNSALVHHRNFIRHESVRLRTECGRKLAINGIETC